MNAGNQVKKILVLAANPKGTSPLRLSEELREIKDGLRRAKAGNLFLIESSEAVRYRDIHRSMLDVEPEIIHFSGHGAKEEGLVFEDEIGRAKPVDAEALAGLFELFADRVKCVVLNACYSEIQARAIAQHIDYVIGMSQAIGDRAAIEFAVGFYDALGSGKSVEFAYELGCRLIRIAGIPEHLTPKLLTKKQPSTEVANTTNILGFHNTNVHQSHESSSSQTQAIEVFLSYSPEDEKLRKELETSLRDLELQGYIRIWHEDKIRVGKNIQVESEKHLNSARIILLLISKNFIASEEKRNEVKRAMERQNSGACIIPVLLSSVPNWQSIRFGDFKLGEFKTLPKNRKFITDRRYWKSQNEAFVTLAEEFMEEVEKLTAESA
ncbi:MAG: TIR domain-containing protein [Fischerella sp.]|nr:TIR domain-containing protein [Fischerella sp.]